MFIDEEEGVKSQITDETAGRVCNLALNPRHRVDKQYLTTLLMVLNKLQWLDFVSGSRLYAPL